MALSRIGPRNVMNRFLMSIILITIPSTGGDGSNDVPKIVGRRITHSTEGPKTRATTIPPVKPIKLESTKAALSFYISLEYQFTAELENQNSAKYVNYSSEFRHMLMDTFIGTPGLQGIDNIRFRNGNISYDVVLNRADRHTLIQALAFINNTVLGKLENMTIWTDLVNITKLVIHMTSPLVYLNDNINSLNICHLLVNPCDFGYECIILNETALCQDKCYSDELQCSNGGECYVDYKYKNLKCQCHDTDEYYYTGDRCEVGITKVQSLSLSAKDYAIIAGSAAGAVLLILIVVHLIRCLRKRYKQGKEDNARNDGKSDLSVAHVSVRMSQLDEPDFDNTTYVYDSGLPEMSRSRRIFRDPHTGEKAMIYQPTFMTTPLSSGSVQFEHISRHPVYHQNDTENPHKLKRPSLREYRN